MRALCPHLCQFCLFGKYHLNEAVAVSQTLYQPEDSRVTLILGDGDLYTAPLTVTSNGIYDTNGNSIDIRENYFFNENEIGEMNEVFVKNYAYYIGSTRIFSPEGRKKLIAHVTVANPTGESYETAVKAVSDINGEITRASAELEAYGETEFILYFNDYTIDGDEAVFFEIVE